MVWDKSRPISSNPPSGAPDYFHENNDCLEDGINREHTFPGTKGSTAGQHTPGGCKVLKVDTTANLSNGIGVAGAISYDTTTGLLMRDTGSALVAITAKDIESGTKMYFYQNTAPTGWTIDATPADALLAVKGGSQAYNVSGGNQAGTWIQPNHTLSISEMPAHTHPYNTNVSDRGGDGSVTPFAYNRQSQNTGSTGGGAAHNHGTTHRPLAQVGIICERD